MPSAQDALGYAAWNEIQRKKDRFSALDELIAADDRSLMSGTALGDFSQELMNAPNSLILSGIESPFNDRLLLSSLAMKTGASSSDIQGAAASDHAAKGCTAKELNLFRSDSSGRYMGICLPDELEQLLALNTNREGQADGFLEDDLYIKPAINHPEGWLLHSDSRCLFCRSRHANHLKNQDQGHSEQRSSRLSVREKLVPFVKLSIQPNPEGDLFELHTCSHD
jgi:hypothetical protein